MNWRSYTFIVLVLTTVTLIIWDVLAEIFGGDPATISRLTYDLSQRYPILPFALGILAGHLLASQHNLPLTP